MSHATLVLLSFQFCLTLASPAFQVLGLLMWATVPGWLHCASFQCQVRTVQAQGRVPTQPLDFCHLGWATSLSPCCLGDGFTDTRSEAFLFVQAHATLCPITHSTRLLPIRVPSPPPLLPLSLFLTGSFHSGWSGEPPTLLLRISISLLGPFLQTWVWVSFTKSNPQKSVEIET